MASCVGGLIRGVASCVGGLITGVASCVGGLIRGRLLYCINKLIKWRYCVHVAMGGKNWWHKF